MNTARGARLVPAGLAVVVLALAAAHVLHDADGLVIELAEASILLVFAAALAVVAVRVRRERHTTRRATRTAATGLGAGVVVGGLATVYVAARFASDEPVTEAGLVLAIGWSLGTSAGCVVGYYVEQVRAERAAQAQLTGRLTVLQRVLRHNIRNEVGVVDGIARTTAESVDDPALASDLQTLLDHVDRIHGLAEKAQTLTDLWNAEGVVEIDLAAATRSEVDRFRARYPEIAVTVSIPGRMSAVVHPSAEVAIREALDNVATHNDDAVAIDVAVTESDEWVTVEVLDDGSSVPEQELAAIAELREFPLQHVTGLGLWIMYWVAELSSGRLAIENRDPQGVRVAMRFPAPGTAAAAEAAVDDAVASVDAVGLARRSDMELSG